MLFISLKGRALTDRVIHHLPDAQRRSRLKEQSHTHYFHTGGGVYPMWDPMFLKVSVTLKKEILDSVGRCYWESFSHAVATWTDTVGSHFQSMCSSGRRNNWAGKTPVPLGESTGEIKRQVKDCKGSLCLAWMVQATAAHIICFPVWSQGYSEPRCWDVVWGIPVYHARWAWCSVVPSPTPTSQWHYHEKLSQALQVTWDASQPDQIPRGDRSCG